MELTEDEIIQSMSNVVVNVIEIISYHTIMKLLDFHVVTT